MFPSSKCPRLLLSEANNRSPCNTCISTFGWLSSAVEKVSVFVAGIVVFLSIILVINPPIVSTPKDNGVTSNSKTSLISPASTAPLIAAPTATTSSGFTVRLGFLKVNFCTNS